MLDSAGLLSAINTAAGVPDRSVSKNFASRDDEIRKESNKAFLDIANLSAQSQYIVDALSA
jgi:hypothetical protein